MQPTLRTRGPGIFSRLRRQFVLRRRLIAGLLCAIAVWAGLASVRAAPVDTLKVWVAARDIEAGARVRESDLTPQEVPSSLAPRGAIANPNEIAGQVLAIPLAAGEPVRSDRFVGSDLASAYPGKSVVPLRIADSDVADLLHPGDEVTVMGADPAGRSDPIEIASNALVIGAPKSGHSTRLSQQGRVVLMAVPAEKALKVAANAASSMVYLVWTR